MIGIGTQRGDDAAGLAVADGLRRRALPAGVDVADCARPALDLLDPLSDCDAVVIVDAMQSGDAPGRVRRVPLEIVRARRGHSSHGLGVAEALQLAAALGRCPKRVEIVAIEAGDAREGALSPAVARGVDAAIDEVLALLGELMYSATSSNCIEEPGG